jgi:transcription elongation factor GreA
VKKPIDLKLTQEGFQKLIDEERDLQDQRPGVLKRMVEAREQGDLSENAGYHAAKERLGYIDSRLRHLKLMIRFAEVARDKTSSLISFGNCVIIEADGQKSEFKIVSDIEADPQNGKMSDKSPIGQALLGRRVGDTVEVKVPDGSMKYKVVAIR